MGYVFKQAVHSVITRGADGKLTGTKSVVKHETDEYGLMKNVEMHDYELGGDGETWVEKKHVDCPNYSQKSVKDSEKKEPVKEQDSSASGRFKEGDILKAEYSDHNVYAAYKDDSTAYWALVTSLFPGKNYLYGTDGNVNFKNEGFNLDKFERASRDEVFEVEKFIEANTGFRWDWRNKQLVRV